MIEIVGRSGFVEWPKTSAGGAKLCSPARQHWVSVRKNRAPQGAVQHKSLNRTVELPNGFEGTEERWALLEDPLLRVDPELQRFSRKRGLRLSKNYHNWPERSLVWYRGSVRNLIQIFLESGEARTYTLWICASEDREGKRYWKQSNLKKAVQFEEIEENLENLLDGAKSELDAWSPSEFGFATKLGVRNA